MTEFAATGLLLAASPIEPAPSVAIEWVRELLALAADFAFETDEWGRFTFIAPDPALNWPASELIGRPAASLLAEAGGGSFDPFRVSAAVPASSGVAETRRRDWRLSDVLSRADRGRDRPARRGAWRRHRHVGTWRAGGDAAG
jgi:hypothetical protein